MGLDFYNGKRVLVTGHTGFKGSWLCKILIQAGAVVTGYALEPSESENLYELSGIKDKMNSVIGDVRNIRQMERVFQEFKPEIVFHLAAQPIVRESYANPVYTYETNVMGTVYVCECIRNSNSVKSFLNVTTDKVYKNNEWEWGYRENEPLDGFDPYSNSKSCSELVTHSYVNSFFEEMEIAVSTARAGNVIGGGDFARDRILPDCFRAAAKKQVIEVRNPFSIRPYQHVLEPLSVYLTIAEKQYGDKRYAGAYNVGPNESDSITTGELVENFCKYWGDGISWESRKVEGPHEAKLLKLDCSKVKSTFGWKPQWNVEKAVEKAVEWYKTYADKKSVEICMEQQIKEFYQAL